MPKKAPLSTAEVYTLKVSLAGLEPVIWRSIEVSGDTSLAKLHRIIQAAMGWYDSHMHLFKIGKRFYGVPDDDGFGPATDDERQVTVKGLLPKKGATLSYIYDMGDDWDHVVKLVEISPPAAGAKLPRLVGGARACPPEDCGGVPGFTNLLDALADPKHEEHAELKEWLGRDFDPEQFDLKASAREVARVR